MTRQDQITSFLEAAQWSDAARSSLAGDASNRRYDRLVKPDGTRAVLMDAPPDKGEDVAPFIQIATFLSKAGLSAPRIYDADRDNGFLLIEDLGDRLFARDIKADASCERPLYAAAVDVLTHLHKVPPPALARYDSAVTTPLAALAFDWYLFGATGAANPVARTAFCAAFQRHMATYDNDLNALIQRDYHAENLLWLPERKGVARVGLLDFQDAMLGHRSYDLVSILQDARRDVSRDVEQEMKKRFIKENALDTDVFEAAYALFGVQRNLRILGVFARLCLRDDKPHYVDFIPRVWAFVRRNLEYPGAAHLAPFILEHLPEPETDILKKLKSESGTCPGR